MNQVPHVPEDPHCACLLCARRRLDEAPNFWRPGESPGTAHFDLARYLRHERERQRQADWERIFKRKEKFD